MQIIDVDGTGSPFDVCRGLSTLLVKYGLAKEYVPPAAPKPAPDTDWFMDRFADFCPRINGHCHTCDGRYVFSSIDLEKLAAFVHCGVQETVPAAVLNQYVKARTAYVPKKPVAPKPETVFANI